MQGVPGKVWPRSARRAMLDRLAADVSSPAAQPLAAAVSAMIVLHVLQAVGMIETPTGWMSFDLGVDRGLGELLGYLICGVVITGLAELARRDPGDRLLRAAAMVFALALVDDLLMVHERLGDELVSVIADPGPEVRAISRAVVLAVVASGVILGWRWLRSTASEAGRSVIEWILVALAIYAGFAIGVDLLHAVVRARTSALDSTLAAVGDGGELVMLAAIASFVLARLDDGRTSAVHGDELVVVAGGRIDLRPTDRGAPGSHRSRDAGTG